MPSFSILILADFFQDVSQATRNYGTKEYYAIFYSVGTAIALLWLSLFILEKFKKKDTTVKRKVQVPLFIELCRAHNLSSEQATMLKAMTTQAGLQPIEVIFIDPALWPQCLKQTDQNQQQLLKIMTQLFGTERVEKWADISSEPTPA